MLVKFCRSLGNRYPRLAEFSMSPGLSLPRRAVYVLKPDLAERVASREFSAGRFESALRELGARRGDSPTALRLKEVEAVLNGEAFVDPQFRLSRRDGDPMKAIHVLDGLASGTSGYGRRTRLILSALDRADISVQPVMRPSWRGIEHGSSKAPRTPEGDFENLPAIDWKTSDNPERDYLAAYATMLQEQADSFGAAVFHAHSDYRNGIAAAWAARRTDRRSVYEVRGLWHVTRASLDPGFGSTRMYRYLEMMEILAMKLSDRVVVPSKTLQDWALDAGIEPDKLVIVPPSIDIDEISPKPRDQALAARLGVAGRFVVGFAGSLTTYEGLDTLVRAAARCLGAGVDIAVVLVGEGPDAPRLRRLADELGLGDRLVLTGQIPSASIGDHYSIFDLCVVIRTDVAVARIVPPIKPAEIMAAGRPLIVTRLPPLLEFGEEGVSRLTIEPGDVEGLSREIARLARDPAACERLATNARRWICENHSLTSAAGAYRSLYEQLSVELARP